MYPVKPTREDVFLQYKLWLETVSGEGIIGEGKIRLLLEVREQGSLRAAAENLGMSYRKAWGDIKKAEKLLGFPLTEKHRGGRSGGSSELTLSALHLLDAWQALKKEINRNMDVAFEQFWKKINREF
jgi:molybdate transport system regulatory protein